jgi:integrase
MKLIKKGGVYHAQIKTASGKTSTITTKTPNLRDAQQVARDSGLPALELAAKSGHLTAEAVGRIVTGNKLTMSKAVDEFLTWLPKVVHQARTSYNYGQVLKQWITADRISSAPPAAITETHIDAFINNKDVDTTATTRNFQLAAIRTFFRFAAAKGWTIGDPSRLVSVNLDILTHRQKERKEVVPFTRKEINALLSTVAADRKEVQADIARWQNASARAGRDRLSNAHDKLNTLNFWEAAIRLTDELAFRLGDIACLEWGSFEKPGHIIVWTQKRDKRVALPISEDLAEHFTTIPILHDRFVFPDQQATAADHQKKAYLSVQFGRLAIKAGIEDKTFHALRHTTITRWHQEGKTLESIAKAVGHSSTKTTKGYVHS